MRITYVLMNAYATGGTVRTVFNQANQLAAAGHHVAMISVVRHRREPHFELDSRVALTTLVDNSPLRGLPRVRRAIRRRLPDNGPGIQVPENEARKRIFTRCVERRIIAALRNISPDVDVLVTTRPALNLLSARFAPSTVAKVGQEHQYLKRHKGQLAEAIRAHYPQLDLLVTLTASDRKQYVRTFGERLRVACVPNAVHSLDVPRADPRAKLVVAAGRLTGAKGFELLIPAFAQVVAQEPQWQLKIFGAGPKEEQLRDLIAQHGMGDNIFLMGRSYQLPEELAKASIYAMSSRVEGFPMVLLEALSHGLPVVSFDCNGVKDIMSDDQEGLIVPRGDIDSFAKALSRLMEDPIARTEMGQTARRTAARYGPGTVTPIWEELFDQVRHPRLERAS